MASSEMSFGFVMQGTARHAPRHPSCMQRRQAGQAMQCKPWRVGEVARWWFLLPERGDIHGACPGQLLVTDGDAGREGACIRYDTLSMILSIPSRTKQTACRCQLLRMHPFPCTGTQASAINATAWPIRSGHETIK